MDIFIGILVIFLFFILVMIPLFAGTKSIVDNLTGDLSERQHQEHMQLLESLHEDNNITITIEYTDGGNDGDGEDILDEDIEYDNILPFKKAS